MKYIKISIFGLLNLGLLTGCSVGYAPTVTNCTNNTLYEKKFISNGTVITNNVIKDRYTYIGIGNNPEQQIVKLEVYKNKKLLYTVDKKSIEEVMAKDKKVIYYEKDSFNFSGCHKEKK